MREDLFDFEEKTDYPDEPMTQEGETLAYRGDATLITKHDTSKSKDDGLFGVGVYLTSDRLIAEDYCFTKGVNCTHVFPNCGDDRRAVQAYLQHLMHEELKFTRRAHELREKHAARVYDRQGTADFDQHHDSVHKEYKAALNELALAILKEAKHLMADRRTNLALTRDTIGNARFSSPDQRGYVTTFSLPNEFIAQMLHADRPIPDSLIDVLGAVLTDCGLHSFSHDKDHFLTWDGWIKMIRRYPMGYAWADETFGGEGKNPTLDEIKNGTHWGNAIFHRRKSQELFSERLQQAGVLGIRFDGGTKGGGTMPRGGGGRRHDVFVVWNDDYLETRRIASTEIAPKPIVTPYEKTMRVNTFNLV